MDVLIFFHCCVCVRSSFGMHHVICISDYDHRDNNLTQFKMELHLQIRLARLPGRLVGDRNCRHIRHLPPVQPIKKNSIAVAGFKPAEDSRSAYLQHNM